jgi:hypothetical protein
MEIQGLVHEIGATQNISDTFKKRDLIIEYAENPEYKEYLKFEAVQDKVNLFDTVKVGEKVEVSFNLRGRAHTKDGKTSYFNSLVAWKLNKLGSASESAHVPAGVESDEDQDLPF